ncbi:hypothetical protein OHC33_000895 [Knufia fluminis]|uniref:DUF6604 domain-containing protein n=1 Tax=Knufia fluminis TaxID=191047 RepID=A0AAN8F093_9EURO|nr:hypothetical protein OHC33_000895 [Knufia fluminis]
MRLPDHLLSSYRQYKEKEVAFLRWVVEAAARCGHPIRVRSPVKQPSTTTDKPRLRGRERTLNRREAAARSGAVPLHDGLLEDALPAVYDILPAIRAIAASPAIDMVPAHVARQLLTVVNLRTKCLNWFQQMTGQDDTRTLEENRNHQYPVEVLQKTLGILEHKLPTQQRRAGSCTVLEQYAQQVQNVPYANKFSILDVDVPLETNSETTSGSNKVDAAPTPMNKTNVIHASEYEYIVARYCMLQDYAAIGDFLVLEMCSQFLERPVLNTLGFLTNAAIDCARKMEEDLQLMFDNAEMLRAQLYTALSTANPGEMDSITRMQFILSEQIKTSIADRFDAEFEQNAAQFPEEVRIRWSAFKDEVARARSKSRDHETHTVGYWDADGEQRFATERLFVTRILEDPASKEIDTYGDVFLDQTAIMLATIHDQDNALVVMLNDAAYSVPAWLAFGFRLRVLAYAIEQDQLPLHLAFMQRMAWTIKLRRLDHKSFLTQSTHSFQASTDSGDSFRKGMTQDIEKLEGVFKASNGAAKQSLQHNFFICAANTFLMVQTYALDAIDIMGTSNVLSMLAWLWSMTKQEDFISTEWADMTFLLECFGEPFVFRGVRPNLNGSRDLLLDMMHAQGLTNPKIVKAIRAARIDPYNIPAGMQLSFKANFTSSSMPFTHLVTTRVRQSNPGLYELGSTDLELVVGSELLPRLGGEKATKAAFDSRDGRISNRAELWKAYHKSPKLEPTQVLELMKREIMHESRIFHFDYLAFEKACTSLIESMLQGLMQEDSAFDTLVSKTTMEKARGIAREVVASAVASSKSKKGQRYKPRLEVVKTAFEQWLPANGSVGSKPAKALFPVNAPTAPVSSLRPDLLRHVREIIDRRGLPGGIFAEEQLEGTNIRVTRVLEDELMGLWAKHKQRRHI